MSVNRGLKSTEVFTAIKSKKKHEVDSSNRSKIPSVNAVALPSNELIDSRFVNAAGIDYVNDTLQVIILQKI